MKAHPSSGKHQLRRQLGLVLVLLAGVAASIFLYHLTRKAEARRAEDEFSRRASVRHTLISESVRGYEECLFNLRNLFANSDDVTPAEFAASARDIRTRHQGIQALQWVPVVPGEKRAETEAWARRNVASFYNFTERDAGGKLVIAAQRGTHFPILYTDPIQGNEPALGFDLSVGPSRKDLDRAVLTKGLVITRKIRLIQELPDVNRFGVIMAAPVFQEVDGVEQLRGFVQVVFRIDDMLGQSWINYPANTLDTLIIDRTQADDPDPFLYSRRFDNVTDTPLSLGGIEELPHRDVYTATLVLGGRTWGCYYTASPGWLESQISHTPLFVLIGSLLLTLVLGAYFISVRRRSELIEQQVNERTAELRHTQKLLEADIAKRQATEAELRESRRQLDSMLGQMPGMAYRYAHGAPRTLSFMSRGSIEIIGATPHDLTSGSIRYEDLIEPEDRARHHALVENALQTQGVYESEYRLRDGDGRIKWVLDRGQGIYSTEGRLLFVEGLAIDITGRKEAEFDKAALDRRLLESQKLESLGVLAGGIAHDFNNLLTTIVGHAGIARLDLPPTSPLQHNLEQIETGAQRAGELCQQMLAYAGKGRFRIQRVSLEKVVRETTPLLEHSISKRASLHFEFRNGVPEVDADLTQIRQIVMNLVVNASDAIGDHDGSITIETCSMRRDDPQLRNAVLPPPDGKGDFACLRVRDTGCGMDSETLRKIFDPFFTTKFAGRGLGLAAVLGIVRGHEGSLLVSTIPGIGSTFTLLLPAAVQAAPEPESRAPFETRTPALAGTVLLIDDEEGVRAVTEHMFRTFGLKTLVASDGEEGIRLFKQNKSSIALVLLDLTMPRMSGAETLRELRAISPQLPVILMSGYNQSALPDAVSDEHIGFLQKPFALESLRKKISKMLS